ncbi:MAG: ABC transporter ATP-binding protein [Deltaproteobacteria bacterium]|nr:MAG: ABC transporter ATP-binding protein [Deltaproteobacteria bacterium]
MTDAAPLLRLEGVIKDYGEEVVTRVLHGVDLTVTRGEFVALEGRSGSGKSTLLNILGLLDRATAGEVWLDGSRVSDLDDAGLTELRARSLGFIFQFHHLINALSAVENVMMPLAARAGRVKRDMRARALAALADVGLADRADESPRRLSGGQQQRVAIARALVADPPLILADEPTGNLDSTTADEVFALLRRATRDKGVAVLMVTHDMDLARRCDRVVELLDGRIVDH